MNSAISVITIAHLARHLIDRTFRSASVAVGVSDRVCVAVAVADVVASAVAVAAPEAPPDAPSMVMVRLG
jgi:hypothetical protein